MSTISPMLQSMLEQQAQGTLSTPTKAPAVQYAPSPIPPEIKPDSVEITNTTGQTKKAKKPMGKSLFKGALIGGGLGFAGGTGLAKYEQKLFENFYKEGKSMKVAETFADLIENKTFGKKVSDATVEIFAKDMGNKCTDAFTSIIKSSKQDADDFVLYIANFVGKNKFLLGGIVAAGTALIGLGIAAIANKVGNKHKE